MKKIIAKMDIPEMSRLERILEEQKELAEKMFSNAVAIRQLEVEINLKLKEVDCG